MKKKTYVITGGAGFIGSSLARRLLERGDAVYILDDLSTGRYENIPGGAVFHNVDISDSGALFALVLPHKADYIYHLAAQSSGEASFEDPARDIDINYKGTYNILRLAQSKGCKRFIFSSSMSVYGDLPARHGPVREDFPCKPISYYGCNKLASESLIRAFTRGSDMDFTIFRLFSVYGPGQNLENMKQGMVSIYLSYLLKNSPIHVKGSIDRFRDFVYIDDVIDVFMQSEPRKETYGEVFNIGTSVKTTVKELLKIILRAYGKDDFDRWVNVKGNTAGDITGCIADIVKLEKKLGWKPKRGLEQGIAKMKEWAYRENIAAIRI